MAFTYTGENVQETPVYKIPPEGDYQVVIIKGEEKIARMKQMYETLGIRESATAAIMGYYNSALEIIEKNDFNGAQKEQLKHFADKLIKRIK